MPPIASISNLNSRLSARTEEAQRDASANGRSRPTAGKHEEPGTQVRILGARRRYRGGYLLNI
jgi:hypothetical protein